MPWRHLRAGKLPVVEPGLVDRPQVGVYKCAATSGPGGHIVGAFSEPVQGLGVTEWNGRFQVIAAPEFGQVQDRINEPCPAACR